MTWDGKTAVTGGFFISGISKLLRTIAYIDGYNLFYGCLKGSSYKWLDIVKLAQRLAKEQNPQAEIHHVKYFTAMVKGRLSKRGELSPQSQETYHRALSATYPDTRLEIVKGGYSLEPHYFHPYQKDQPIPLDEKVAVWRPEEKQTDVNIALHMYRDVVQGICDAQILFSNDTDLSPAIRFVKEYKAEIDVGVVIPRKASSKRPPNKSASDLTDWCRKHISDEELAACQLPDLVGTKKKPAIKPDHW